MPNYAVVEPLRTLLRKDNAFSCPTTAQVSFDKVKHMIVNSPALALFDPRLQIIFSTDASHYDLNTMMKPVESREEILRCRKGGLSLRLGCREVENLAVGKKVCTPNRPSSSHNASDGKR